MRFQCLGNIVVQISCLLSSKRRLCNVAYLVDPIHPRFPLRRAFVGVAGLKSPRYVLDNDADEVVPWYASDPDVCFVGVEEDDVHVEGGQSGIQSGDVTGE